MTGSTCGDGHRTRRGEGTGKFRDHLPHLQLSLWPPQAPGVWPSGNTSLPRWAGRNFPCSRTQSDFTTRAVTHGLSASPNCSIHQLTRWLECLPYAQHCAKPSAPSGGTRGGEYWPHESSLIPGPWRKRVWLEKGLFQVPLELRKFRWQASCHTGCWLAQPHNFSARLGAQWSAL